MVTIIFKSSLYRVHSTHYYLFVRAFHVKVFMDNMSFPQVSLMEPGIEELRKSMPKAIAIPSHDWGVEGDFFLHSNEYSKINY